MKTLAPSMACGACQGKPKTDYKTSDQRTETSCNAQPSAADACTAARKPQSCFRSASFSSESFIWEMLQHTARVSGIIIAVRRRTASSSEDSSSEESTSDSDSDMAQRTTNPGGRASSTDFASAVAVATVVTCSLDPDAQLHHGALRVRILSSRASQAQEAELQRQQQALRLLWRQTWHCAVPAADMVPETERHRTLRVRVLSSSRNL